MSKFNSILLVEDDAITTLVCERIIKMDNFANEVITKVNGLEALNYLKDCVINNNATIPEVIFLDINMPILNGWDFLKEFEQIKHQLTTIPKIYILSSTVDPEDFKKANQFSTFKGTISKPLTKEHLQTIA